MPADSSSAARGSAPTAPYVARCEADLAVMVPLVLGFHPSESVVLMTFGEGAGSFHARVDLPHDPELHGCVTDALVTACRSNGVRRAAVIVYAADHGLALQQAGDLVASLWGEDVEVIDALRVHEGEWFALLGPDAPIPVGTPFDVDSHPFTARGVFEGRAVQRGRDDVRRLLEGRAADPERGRLLSAARRRRRLVRTTDLRAVRREAWWLRDRVQTAVRTGDRLDTVDASRVLGLVAAGHQLRDVAWVDLTRDEAGGHVELWLDLVRRSPSELSAGPSALLALSSYVAGDGALAWCAVDRCREVEPEHTLARLVADVLAAAVSPLTWPRGDPAVLALLAGGRP